MKVLIDINHPAHVHYFRNLYKKLDESGHQIIVVSRNKEIEQELLRQYEIPFISRGKGAFNFIGKVFYHFYAVIFLARLILKYRVDTVISFMHPYAAQASWLLRKRSVLFSDTENARLHHKMTVPFASEIHTPACFEIELGKKHKRFEGFMELSYLHPNYFVPDESVLDELKIDNNKPVTIVRFVSWRAVHDIGHSGIQQKEKLQLIEALSEISNVFISSESKLPKELRNYELNINKTKIHSLLYYSDLFIGESATMASESAMLGTPAIYFDNEGRGYTNYLEERYGLVTNYSEKSDDISKAIQKAKTFLDSKTDYKSKRNEVLKESVDTTEYMYKTLLSVVKP